VMLGRCCGSLGETIEPFEPLLLCHASRHPQVRFQGVSRRDIPAFSECRLLKIVSRGPQTCALVLTTIGQKRSYKVRSTADGVPESSHNTVWRRTWRVDGIEERQRASKSRELVFVDFSGSVTSP
jgi:hypothetical protein